MLMHLEHVRVYSHTHTFLSRYGAIIHLLGFVYVCVYVYIYVYMYIPPPRHTRTTHNVTHALILEQIWRPMSPNRICVCVCECAHIYI